MEKIKYLVFSALVFAACENEIPLGETSPEGILCVNGFLAAEGGKSTVSVSLTGDPSPFYVKAKVELRVNGELKETSVSNGQYTFNTVFHAGDKVRVDAYYEDQHAWAEDTAPEKVENLSLSGSFVRDLALKNSTINCYNIHVSFDDKSGADYYRLTLTDTTCISQFVNYYYDYMRTEGDWFFGTLFYTDSIIKSELAVMKYYEPEIYNYYYKDDAVLTAEESTNDNTDLMLLDYDIKNEYKVFSDKMFDGKKADLNVYISGFFGHGEHSDILPEVIEYYDNYGCRTEWDLPVYDYFVTADLYSLTENEYYYLKALNALESEFYDTFSDLTGPMSMPTNVNGGCGNVCISTLNRVSVQLVDGYRPVAHFKRSYEIEHREGNYPRNYKTQVYINAKPSSSLW